MCTYLNYSMFLTTKKLAVKFASAVQYRSYYKMLLVCEVFAALTVKCIYGFFARLKVRNGEYLHLIDPPYLIVANHANYNDPFIIGAASFFKQKKLLPYCFMTLPKFLEWPIRGKLIRLVGSFPVFPKAGSLDESLEVAIRILKERRGSIIMFPEGKRNAQHHHQNARPGIAHLMKKFPDIPVVPMFISGNQPIPPLSFFLGRMKLMVTIGKPFTCRDIEGEKKDNIVLAREVMQRIMELEKNG